MEHKTHKTESEEMSGPFITKRELARRLNLCPRTINNYMTRGWLPYYRLGRAVIFREIDVEVFLQKIKNAPPVSAAPQPSTINH